jgi:hypothetical protein
VHTELGATYYSRRRYEIALEELASAKSLSRLRPGLQHVLVYMELKEDAKRRKKL